ncbi:phosphotransferase [Methyloligella solikamskensis]|uniref:Phosphotransferase n=1 Tax=Methyloligella solikamskensis TaxID=1177756 RepID=A0ABW3JCG0_9HYPH
MRRPLGFTHRYCRIALFTAAARLLEFAAGQSLWSAKLHELSARDYARVDALPSAIAAYETATAYPGSPAAWHLKLAQLLIKSKHFKQAAMAYETAVSRDGREASWHYELGRAHELSQNWASAEAAFAGAVARDDVRADYHAKVGQMRSFQQNWDGATEAYLAALERDPDKENYRYQAARYLSQAGRAAEAEEIMEPVCAENDALLRDFLKSRYPGQDVPFSARTMLVGGAQTRSAREIQVEGPNGVELFFEHTVQDPARSAGRRKFYEDMWQATGRGTPDLLPELHHYVVGARFAYFLYDFLPSHTSAQPLDRAQSMAIVDRLSEITTRLLPILGEPDNKAAIYAQISHVNAQTYLAVAARHHADGPEEAEDLRALSARWPSHKARFKALPQTLVHGDLHHGNLLLDHAGRIKIIDWDLSGVGPMGLDLVHFFAGRIDADGLDDLADRYFDAVEPAFSRSDRRYTVALLSVMWSIAKNRRPDQKWIHALATA